MPQTRSIAVFSIPIPQAKDVCMNETDISKYFFHFSVCLLLYIRVCGQVVRGKVQSRSSCFVSSNEEQCSLANYFICR